MKKSDSNRFRPILAAKLDELRASVRRRETIQIERHADDLDRLLEAAQREVAVQNLAIVSVRMREVEAALARIDQGTYGECQCCDEPIGPARLSAVPWARFCIVCQEDADQNGSSNWYPMAA